MVVTTQIQRQCEFQVAQQSKNTGELTPVCSLILDPQKYGEVQRKLVRLLNSNGYNVLLHGVEMKLEN